MRAATAAAPRATAPHATAPHAAAPCATDRARLVLELRRSGVTDPKVLSAVEAAPRHMFVPREYAARAWDDTALPIACGQAISQPTVVAWMSAALELDDRMTVLEVGTGSGYQAAVLSRLCRRVYTVERRRPLALAAKARFEALGMGNVTTRIGDGCLGWPGQAPFPRILVTAAAPAPPPALVDQLAMGGVMVMPVGAPDGEQDLVQFRRAPEGLRERRLFGVRFVPLIEGAPAP